MTAVSSISSSHPASTGQPWPAPGEPTITRKERHISFDWLVKEDKEHGDRRRHLACLSISHERAGANMFSGRQHANRYTATLRRETETRASYGGVARGFVLFGGFALLRQDAGRFSPLQFEQFAGDALVKLFDMYAVGNERALSYFDPDQGGRV